MPLNNLYNEKELLELIVASNRKAFDRILEHYWLKVYTQAITYLRSSEDAQEITQDIFVKIWQHRSKLSEVEDFSAWLFILTKNQVLMEFRKKKVRPVIVTEPDGNTYSNTTQQPDYPLFYKETMLAVTNAIELLPPTRKKVFLMSRLEDKSYDEIATELGISRNGVKDHIVKALHFLRGHLEKNGVAISFFIQLLCLNKNNFHI